jgi:serine/threonine protein kinase
MLPSGGFPWKRSGFRFFRTLIFFADLRHPSIVGHSGSFFQGNSLFVAVEYCDVGSLAGIMRLLKRPLSEAEISAALLHGTG